VDSDPEKIVAVKSFSLPTNPKKVKSFVCLCSWYQHLIPDFSQKAEPMNMSSCSENEFVWGKSQRQSVTLAFPNFTKPFLLRTDASDYGFGAV
jgi:hypothetical protein